MRVSRLNGNLAAAVGGVLLAGVGAGSALLSSGFPPATPIITSQAIGADAASARRDRAPMSVGEFWSSAATLPGGRYTLEPPQQGYRGYREAIFDPSSGLREFYFTRAIYSGWGGRYGRGGNSWRTDYPKADRQFLWGLRRISNLDAYEGENAIVLTDPDLRRFPFLYALEVGYMQLTPPEVEALRQYLDAGGFLFIDDFWGTREWDNFQYEIHRVLPEYEIVELPLDHPLFSIFYEIDEVLQVPGVRYAWYGGTTWERDGYTPHVRAIFDDHDRLLVLINWNTDLGDAWEWAEDPFYPLVYSNFAYQLGLNAIIYAMSH